MQQGQHHTTTPTMNSQGQVPGDLNDAPGPSAAPTAGGLPLLSGTYGNPAMLSQQMQQMQQMHFAGMAGQHMNPAQFGQQPLLPLPLPQGLTYTTDADARRAVLELIQHNSKKGIDGLGGDLQQQQQQEDGGPGASAASKKELLMKRACLGGDGDQQAAGGPIAKKARVDDNGNSGEGEGEGGDADGTPAKPTPKKVVNYDPNVKIPESKVGLSFYEENDVLCGRGGGTNVHPGNKLFRDLINSHRRDYLRAKKNDKPDISRSIVRIVRETGGRFLKRDEKSGLWFEIGDDGAREKTSQALRQRAPEMRRLLFRDEYNQEEIDYRDGCVPVVYHPNPAENAYLRSLSEGLFKSKQKDVKDHHQQQQQQGMTLMPPSSLANLDAYKKDLMLQARYGAGGAPGMIPTQMMDPQMMYLERGAQQWRTEALLGGGLNRFTPHGA